MTRRRPKFLPTIILSLSMLAATSGSARADDEEAPLDARLEGYPTKVDVGGSTALTYLLLVFLSLVALGVMFKDAKRSHLD